jgi:CHAD domain-containing protein
MNSGLIALNRQGKVPVEPDLRNQFKKWCQLLEKCGDKPTRRRIHALRVSTLRLRAEVDLWLQDHGTDDPARDAAKEWTRQAKRLRDALSPVRDSDVYLAMLKGLRTADAGGETCRSSRTCLREIERLEQRLQQKRASGVKRLIAEIDGRRARLEWASGEMEEYFANRRPWARIDRVRVVRGLIAGLAAEIPNLSANTLHEFRKHAKTARYLADVFAKSDPLATHRAELLKKMQTAAGEWHDWQTLAAKAQHTFGTSEEDGLVDVLERRAEESLHKALDVCRHLTAQLIDHGARNGVFAESLPHKRPVKRAEPASAASAKRVAGNLYRA